MSKLFNFNILTTIFLVLALLCYLSTTVHAMEVSNNDEKIVKKYGLTFPVAELNNCTTIIECKTYCSNPANAPACIDFAKKKGFYNQQSQDDKKTQILATAKGELGCDSENSCKAFCGEQENWIKCGEFAKRHNIGGGQTNKVPPGINKGPQGMPAYQNADEKARFCQEFPEKCKMATQSSQIKPADPAAACSQYAQYGCTWTGSICSCPGKTPYCQPPAAGCGAGNAWDFSNCTCRTYQDYCQSKPNCHWTDNSCKCTTSTGGTITYPPPPSPYPAKTTIQDYCQSKPGCTWTGTNCQCSTQTPSPTPFSSTTNIGTYSSVKGVSHVRSFLEKILDYFK